MSLPTDAKSPVINEIETDTSRAFSIYLYANDNSISKALLFDRAITLQKAIEKVSGINNVNLAAGGDGSAIGIGGGNDSSYEVHVVIPNEKLNALGLTLANISSIIG